jgi:hypothetical protein
MDYFIKRPEPYAIPNREASTVAEALFTNFCRFALPLELHSDQRHNLEFRLIQEVSQRQGVSRTHTAHLHLQSDGMIERYIKISRITYETSSRRTRGIGTQDYPF